MLCALLANCHRDDKRRPKPYEPKDFIPRHLLRDPLAPPPARPDPRRMALVAAQAWGAPPEILKEIAARMKPEP